ncbi:hypothetical protein FPV67DRAFT_1668753 [Lyophyllum atratum]|nr:hypothetical protein FPV67DRAFT_1668753 [Lyophyllum atratum]
MPELPQEVWHLIVSYVWHGDVNKLMYMNRALLNVVLDQRYRKVEWVILDNRLVKYMVRLQDPYIAARVRSLHIRAYFIQFLFRREQVFTDMETPHVYGMMKQISKFFQRSSTQPVIAGSERIAITNGLGVLSSSKQILCAMANAIHLMKNVTEFNFEWNDLPFNQGTEALLMGSRRAFDTSLFKLVIHARTSHLERFLSLADFHVLGELELHLDPDPPSEDPHNTDEGAPNEMILVRTVAPFINRLRSSLRALAVSSSAKGDHTPFLSALGPLPKLRALNLHVSFSQIHLSDASPIGHLLHTHKATLISVEVCPNPPPRSAHILSGVSVPPHQQPRDPYVAMAWAAVSRQSLTDTTWLANLESLTIPTLDHASTLAVLRHVPPTLTRLCLVDGYLKTREVEDILAMLRPRPRLRYLSIAVITLSPGIFTALANTLPSLYSLTVVLGVNIVSFMKFYTILSAADSLNPWFFVGLQYNPRASELIMQRYPLQMDWALVDLSIFFHSARANLGRDTQETRFENRIMLQIKDYVLPNLKSFRGLGHTRLEFA